VLVRLRLAIWPAGLWVKLSVLSCAVPEIA
jgi:hypothetical protein